MTPEKSEQQLQTQTFKITPAHRERIYKRAVVRNSNQSAELRRILDIAFMLPEYREILEQYDMGIYRRK